MCEIIRGKCKDIERQNLLSNISEKISFVYYCEIKQKWGKESYADKCTRKEGMGTWLKAGIRRGSDRGRSPLCLGEEDAKHILMNCPETKKWREELVCNKWLIINEDKDHWEVFI